MQLTPITVDGRTLTSSPCDSKSSTLSRYMQNETYSKVEVLLDTYTQTMRLNLYAFDGTPVNAMWQHSTTPLMLPTTTLTPTATTSSKPPMNSSPSSSPPPPASQKVRRALGLDKSGPSRRVAEHLAKKNYNANNWLWIGLGLSGFGGALIFLC